MTCCPLPTQWSSFKMVVAKYPRKEANDNVSMTEEKFLLYIVTLLGHEDVVIFLSFHYSALKPAEAEYFMITCNQPFFGGLITLTSDSVIPIFSSCNV